MCYFCGVSYPLSRSVACLQAGMERQVHHQVNDSIAIRSRNALKKPPIKTKENVSAFINMKQYV